MDPKRLNEDVYANLKPSLCLLAVPIPQEMSAYQFTGSVLFYFMVCLEK